jgi:DNA replication initiation complex subunit (GINS family)
VRIDYDEVRRIHRLERTSSSLVDVEEDFFESLNSFFNEERRRFVQDAEQLTEAKSREFSNLRKMIAEIVAAREKKLLNKALAMARTGDSAQSRLADPEKKILAKLVACLNDYSSMVGAITGLEPAAGKKDFNPVAVRIIKDIPAFAGEDRATWGPFSRNSVVDLPQAVADILLKRKLAETP